MEGKRVLVVDDEFDIRAILGEYLHFKGFEVDLAANGQEALQALSTTTYDVVLSDVVMPVMNGLELVQNIRKVHDCTQLPLVMMTGTHGDDLQALHAQGLIQGYLTKPIIDLEELVSTLLQALV